MSLLARALAADPDCAIRARDVYHRREGHRLRGAPRAEVFWHEALAHIKFRWPLVSVTVDAEPVTANAETLDGTAWQVLDGKLQFRVLGLPERWQVAQTSLLNWLDDRINAAYAALHAVPRTVSVRITWSPDHDAQAEEVDA